jgi:hypothetical protein
MNDVANAALGNTEESSELLAGIESCSAKAADFKDLIGSQLGPNEFFATWRVYLMRNLFYLWWLIFPLGYEGIAESEEPFKRITAHFVDGANPSVRSQPDSSSCEREQQLNTLLPDAEVACLLGAERAAVEMGHNDMGKFGDSGAHEDSLWIAVLSLLVRGDDAAAEIGLNVFEDGQIVVAKLDPECCPGPVLPLVSWVVGEQKASLAIHQTAQPVAEGVAVDVGRKRRDRLAGSHDSYLHQGRGCWSEPHERVNACAARLFYLAPSDQGR